MNWSTVKNFLIAILLAANLFLVFNIVRQDRTRNYISAEEISDAQALLENRGLSVSKNSIPTKKLKASVYESLYNDEYYTDAAEALTGSERDLLLSLPNGGFSIVAKNGETVEFDTEFGFVYCRYDTSEILSYTDITADNFSVRGEALDELSAVKMESLALTAKKFLDRRTSSDYGLSAEVTEGYYDSATGYSVVLAKQCIDGYEVYPNYAVCVFSGSELVYARGKWYFAPLTENYNTELQNQINALFADLEALKAESESASYDEVKTDGGENGENAEFPAVDNMSPCYVIYWNSEKTALYFTPAWQIKHINGLTIVYNAANGTIHSQKS